MTSGPVRIATSGVADTEEAVAEVVAALVDDDPVLVMAFVGGGQDLGQVAVLLRKAFPNAQTLGCSTAGEFGPDGFRQASLAVFALVKPARCAVAWFDDLAEATLTGSAESAVDSVCAELGLAPSDLAPDRHCFVTLVDGMTGSGELFIASVGHIAPGIPLVGGSAGTAMNALQSTWTFANGHAAAQSGALLLIEPGVPFVAFATHNFEHCDERLVVTAARPDQHLLDEINGWPARREYARVSGLNVDDLIEGVAQPAAFPTQLGFLAGGTVYLRGLLGFRGDSLLLGGAVDQGMVLRVTQVGEELVDSTVRAIRDASATVGPVSGRLLFECVGRRMQAERTGCLDELSSVYATGLDVGFHTFGEQFGTLQVNFTLTGLVFGVGDG